MHSVDTNVLVRFWIEDDLRQSAAVTSLFASEPIWISQTVLLETAWVLGSIYAYDDATVCRAFRTLLGVTNIYVENAAAVADALGLCEKGLEFADALHLSNRPSDATFVTFDQALVKRARRAGVRNVSSPSAVR